jgi:hypothetical protein
MVFLGIILILISLNSISGNFRGGGTTYDPAPNQAGFRLIIWLIVGVIGVALLFIN